jgi:hypothetical protein
LNPCPARPADTYGSAVFEFIACIRGIDGIDIEPIRICAKTARLKLYGIGSRPLPLKRELGVGSVHRCKGFEQRVARIKGVVAVFIDKNLNFIQPPIWSV